MEKVAIIGLGLIGTSIGLGLRRWAAAEEKRGPALRVVGFDVDMAQQQQARSMKATDEVTWDMPSAVRDADLVIVATPVGAVREVFTTIGDHLKHGSVVTDTCSTKAQVMEWARELRALLESDEGPGLEAYFTRARDARADWATAERTDGALLQETEDELSKTTLGSQFGQMLFGGLARRRRLDQTANDRAAARQERADRT